MSAQTQPIPKNSSPLLDIQIHRKAFADTEVLAGVDLQLYPRDAVALLGPSGCGKSTLLRIAAGLDSEFEGHIQRSDPLVQERGGGIAFIFQEPRLMPWLKVRDNIGFADGKAADSLWIDQLLKDVGLSGWAEALPKQLSGGMAQRVAIARGLYSRPRILLLDEPFSAVDPFTRMRLQDLLLTLADHYGIAVLLVTHDVDEALYLGQRVVVLGTQPSRVCGVLEVPLHHPRDRADPELAHYRAQALRLLREAHAF